MSAPWFQSDEEEDSGGLFGLFKDDEPECKSDDLFCGVDFNKILDSRSYYSGSIKRALTPAELASIKTGGFIYVKNRDKPTEEIPLRGVADLVAKAESQCSKEVDVWE